MKVVRKKILPEFFQAVRAREKNFEIREDEDDIQVGDLLILGNSSHIRDIRGMESGAT